MKRNSIVIAYTAPGPEWDTVRQHADQVKAVVFNPNNGVGAAKDGAYAELRKEMRALGILVLGYVYTASGPIGGDRVYSNRDPAQVLHEVRQWKEWYGVDGIFFDEVATGDFKVPYGRRTVGTARGVIPGAFIILNFGTVPDEAWKEVDAVMCVTEKRQSTYLTEPFPSWTEGVDPERLLDIVYEVTDVPAVMARFTANGHGMIYLTDVPGPDPQYSVDRTLWPPEPTPAPAPVEDPNWAAINLRLVAVALQAPANSTLADVPNLAAQRMLELVQLRAQSATVRLSAVPNDQLLEELGRRLAL